MIRRPPVSYRTDTLVPYSTLFRAVFLGNQGSVVERLVGIETPELPAHAPVQVLGQGLGQAVGQRLEQDDVVVVVVGAEALDVFLDADPGGDRETADPVLPAAILRRDEVGEAEVGTFERLVDPLAEEVPRTETDTSELPYLI